MKQIKKLEAKISTRYYCRDCNKVIKTKGKQIIGGKLLKYKDGDKGIMVMKCSSCFKKDPTLTNYQPCEVYSRVVGYYRPVSQWNIGKEQEFRDRKNFKITK